MKNLNTRFSEKFKIDGSCWIWIGSLDICGYGKFFYNRKCCRASRVSYEIYKGKIPKGKLVCHTCDNRKCVNPDHLWLGTHLENMEDCKKKGRVTNSFGRKASEETRKKLRQRPHSDRRGEKHHLTHLTNENIFEIRKLIESGMKLKEIGLLFGVKRATIKNIKHRRSWSHI